MNLKTFFSVISILIVFQVTAQNTDTSFSQAWKQVNADIAKRDLTTTALASIKKIYQQAKEKKLSAQVIKALIYQYSLEDRLTDNEPDRTINQLKMEIISSIDPLQKSILHALLAKKYWQYFSTNRWRYYIRKTTTNKNESSITTWSMDDLNSAITHHFLLSIADRALLQKQPTSAYSAVVVKGTTGNETSLYDLLAREALNYFKSGEPTATRAEQLFTLSNENALGTIDEFIRGSFPAKDSSLQWIALDIYKQLLVSHKNDADKNILVQWNLDRIEWVCQQAVFPDKGKKYLQALAEMAAYTGTSSAAQAWYLRARYESDKAAGYQPFADTTGHYGYLKAEGIIVQALSIYKDSSTGTVNMRNLLMEIHHKDLKTETERVNIPGKPFRARVEFRNVDTVYGRIIRIENDTLRKGDPRNIQYWRTAAEQKVYRTFIQILPGAGDYQPHSTEIKLDSLAVGEYALLVSSDSRFDANTDKMSRQLFYVSNISYIKNNADFFVLDRQSGRPLTDAKVNIHLYDINNHAERIVKKTTDEYGFFGFLEGGQPRALNYHLDIRKGDDRLYQKENDLIIYQNQEEISATAAMQQEARNARVFFFTDRSIYRPGQLVFFKGIGITNNPKTKLSKLVADKESFWAYLNDKDSRQIDSAKFTLNEYGSFSGQFRIPENLSPGYFSISAPKYNHSTVMFSVEEYKRPTFQVQFQKVTASYRLGDSITVTGTVNSYTGNVVDGAKVRFNALRQTKFISELRSPISPAIPQRQISSGEIITDATGRFTIRFKALVDDISLFPEGMLLNFVVSADITDNNGETRSATVTVPVSNKTLLLHVTVPAIVDIDSLKKIVAYSTNLNDEKEMSVLHMRIFALLGPGYPVKKRYWPKPDMYIMTKQEFYAYFPTDEYIEESNYETWNNAGLIMESSINTKEQDNFTLTSTLPHPGIYRIEVSTIDKYGQPVKTLTYIQVFSRKSSEVPMPGYQFNYTITGTAQPGETAVLIHGSSIDDQYIIRKKETEQSNTSSDYEFVNSKKGLETIKKAVTEADRGGMYFNEAYVHDNRFYTYRYAVSVPWNNKHLDIQYSTYRDKTEPGSKEKWTVTIATDKTHKAAAELLTGMYDASLDQFNPHNWTAPFIWRNYFPVNNFLGSPDFAAQISDRTNFKQEKRIPVLVRYDRLANNFTDFMPANTNRVKGDTVDIPLGSFLHEVSSGKSAINAKRFFGDGPTVSSSALRPVPGALNNINIDQNNDGHSPLPVTIRKNFNETAFFFPQLHADSSGNYSFSFTMPDALTKWKWMSIAHTKDLAFGENTADIITQKKLMIQANAPRFLREGDNMEFSAKISNLDDKEITGQVSFELFDPSTNVSVDGWFQNIFPSQYFTVAAGQSFAVRFPIQIPVNFNKTLGWRVIAKSGNMSDGEENVLPVLSNRILVTETLPLLLQNESSKHFSFDKLLNTSSESLTHAGLTVEYTSNPVWSAVQALPYLIEFPYECAEQTFNRFYANTLASFIINKNPSVKKVFEEWKKDTTSLKTNLEKNEDLKQVLLQETPWVLDAETETAKKQHLANLFDMATLGAQSDHFIEKLSQQQLPDGAFPWFQGGREDRYITNYIVTGIGKLKRLGALSPDLAIRLRSILENAVKYLDGQVEEEYKNIMARKKDTSTTQVSGSQVDYLYMRSFFGDIQQASPTAWQYFYSHAKRFWTSQNSFYKAELGMAAIRNGDKDLALRSILPALLENSVTDTSKGMYWKSTYASWWYQSPVEHQSTMIAFASEALREQKVTGLERYINNMKTWLLLNKQTNNWRTTIATADACYALLLNGTDWLSDNKTTTIQLGNYTISSKDQPVEAGTGYFKKRIDGKMVQPSMGNITVTTSSTTAANTSQASWGSVYWQYFEEMDKVTAASGPLSVVRKLFIEKNSSKGKVLESISEGEEVKIGDKVVIRIELRSDRDLDYLHLKDTRAAGMEPVNVLSGYKWQDGLGYYESTKDASSNFFISHIGKGTYIFEYPVFITHTGVFSAGLATIQCMYAPEFTSHSEGIKIRVASRN